jgi:hypothetical protein
MKTKRNLWPLGILSAFVMFFGGMTAAVTIAVTHGDSLVSANYYERELRYQNQIDAAEHAERSGANIRVDATAGKMLVAVPPEQVKHNLRGRISFYRANAPELDREFDFAPGSDGRQSFDSANFAPGSWRVRVSWQSGGQDYYLEQKVTL